VRAIGEGGSSLGGGLFLDTSWHAGERVGPVAAAREQRSRVTTGRRYSAEQRRRGLRHVGPTATVPGGGCKIDSKLKFKQVQTDSNLFKL
jgi:hypothetical protein